MGRARHQASALASGLEAQGAKVLSIPFIEIRRPKSYEPLDTALKNIDQYDWLILTSVNGVNALHSRMKDLRLEKKNLRHLHIAAIGPATRKAIEMHGLKVHTVPKEYVAESVVRSLRRKVKGKRVLLARAKVARDVIPRELRKLRAKVDVVEAYETVVPAKSKIKLRTVMNDTKHRPHVITFTSSSTVKNFLALVGKQSHHTLQNMKFASIGPITSATLKENGLSPHIEAEKFTIPGLIKAICKNSAHIST